METEERNSFVFYRTFQKAISHLPNEEKLIMYEAITAYGLDNTTPKFENPYLNMAWEMVIVGIDSAQKKWNKSKENGKLGGRPKGSTKSTETKTTETKKEEPKTEVKQVKNSTTFQDKLIGIINLTDLGTDDKNDLIHQVLEDAFETINDLKEAIGYRQMV